MRHAFKASLIGAMGALVAAPAAFAGCGPAALQPASYQSGSGDARLIPASLGVQGIVGLWAVNFTVGGNPFDWGYSAYHDDGTEILNSGSRAPATENFCMGVWRQSGPNTYHVKHFALSYSGAGVLQNRITITEDLTVDGTGNSFTGPVAYDVYDSTGANHLAHIPGQVSGHRLLPN
jgi:hypothetical protein